MKIKYMDEGLWSSDIDVKARKKINEIIEVVNELHISTKAIEEYNNISDKKIDEIAEKFRKTNNLTSSEVNIIYDFKQFLKKELS